MDVWIILLAAGWLLTLAWVFWPKRKAEPLRTAVTFMLEDGQVLTLCFDGRGHLARVVHRESNE